MSKVLHHAAAAAADDDDDDDAEAIAMPRVFSENSRANKLTSF